MPKRIALVAIGVTRDGKTVYPPIGDINKGEPFDFTSEEISQIEALEKANDVQMLRKLRNEGSSSSQSLGTDDDSVDPTAPKTFTMDNTVAELKAEATARGLDFSKLKTKAELVSLLDTNPVKVEGDDEQPEGGEEDL